MKSVSQGGVVGTNSPAPGSPSGEWSDEQHHVAPEGAQRPCFICAPDDPDADEEGCIACEDRWIQYVTQLGY